MAKFAPQSWNFFLLLGIATEYLIQNDTGFDIRDKRCEMHFNFATNPNKFKGLLRQISLGKIYKIT